MEIVQWHEINGVHVVILMALVFAIMHLVQRFRSPRLKYIGLNGFPGPSMFVEVYKDRRGHLVRGKKVGGSITCELLQARAFLASFK